MTRQRTGWVWAATAWIFRLVWRLLYRFCRGVWVGILAACDDWTGWRENEVWVGPVAVRRALPPRAPKIPAVVRPPLPPRDTPTGIVAAPPPRPRALVVPPTTPRMGIETVKHDPALLVGGLCQLGYKKPAAWAAVEQAIAEHPGAPTADLMRHALASMRPK